MDSEIIDVFNRMGSLGAGSILAILIGIASVCFTAVTIGSAIYKKIKDVIENAKADAIEEYSDDLVVDAVQEDVQVAKNEINELKTKVDELATNMQAQQSRTDEKVDKLCKIIEQKRTESRKEDEELRQDFREISSELKKATSDIASMKDVVDDLVESDQTSLKAFITEQYHKSVPTGEIDTLTMAVIEEKFARYNKRGGNSYVSSCVKAMEQLKKVSVTETNDTELLHYIAMYGGIVPDSK